MKWPLLIVISRVNNILSVCESNFNELLKNLSKLFEIIEQINKIKHRFVIVRICLQVFSLSESYLQEFKSRDLWGDVFEGVNKPGIIRGQSSTDEDQGIPNIITTLHAVIMNKVFDGSHNIALFIFFTINFVDFIKFSINYRIRTISK